MITFISFDPKINCFIPTFIKRWHSVQQSGLIMISLVLRLPLPISVVPDLCYEKYECLESWYQPHHKIIGTHYRKHTSRDCAAECCKNDKCVSYEWIRSSRVCYTMSSWLEQGQLSPSNGRMICQLKQGESLSAILRLKHFLLVCVIHFHIIH